jgi:tetratricopeptide (TPR) repeat protein
MTALNKSFYSEREIEILISKANIYILEHKTKEASNIYKDALLHVQSLPEVINKHVPVRLFYNYSRATRLDKNYGESIRLCDKGIKLTEQYKLMYLKGDLYFQKGLNYKALDNKIKAIENFKLAEMIYTIESNQNSLELTRNNLCTLTTSVVE